MSPSSFSLTLSSSHLHLPNCSGKRSSAQPQGHAGPATGTACSRAVAPNAFQDRNTPFFFFLERKNTRVVNKTTGLSGTTQLPLPEPIPKGNGERGETCLPNRMNHSEVSRPANSSETSCVSLCPVGRSLQTRGVCHGAEQYCCLFDLSSPPTQLHREAPSTLPCVPSPGLSVIVSFQHSPIPFLFTTIQAIHHPQCLTASASGLVLFICVSAREREFSWRPGTEQEQGTRNTAFSVLCPSCPTEIGNSQARQDIAHISSFLLSSCCCSFIFLSSERQNTFSTPLQ